MCLILFAFQYQQSQPLVVAANRDEFFGRKTEQAAFWKNCDSLLAGQDLEQGGTWLGINKSGRFAAVTNFREEAVQGKMPRSRGALPREFLQGNESPTTYLEKVIDYQDEFAGFNLLVGDSHQLFYFSNRQSGIHQLQPGIYGLSNHLLDSPWPKVTTGKQELQNLLNDDHLTTDALIQMMRSTQPADDNDLPSTSASLELERALSPRFILDSERNYGTRCTTAFIIDNKGRARFSEQNYYRGGKKGARSFYEFATREAIQPPSSAEVLDTRL